MPDKKANAPAMKGSQSVQRGWKAYSQGDVSQAEAVFLKAAGEAPEAAFPILQYGLFLLRQDRFTEASTAFSEAVAKEEQNPAPLFFLALSRELEGDTEQADSDLEKLALLCPRHQGLASLRLLREIRRGDPLASLHQLGFGQKVDSAPSWRVFAAGLGMGNPGWLPPDLSSSQYLMGPILVEVEKRLLPREIPHLEHRPDDLLTQVEGLKPPQRKLLEELKGLKNSWKSGPKLRKGRQILEKAMGIEDIGEQRAELDKAIALLEEGHRLDEFAFRNNYHLGEAYLFTAKNAPGTPYLRAPLERAEACFLESARMDGLNPYVLFYLALIQQLLGRPKPAIDAYAKATEKFTKLPEAHYGTGQCHLLLGELQQAREFLLKAVSSDLALARERLTLFANLLQKEGLEAFVTPLPVMPPVSEPLADLPNPEPDVAPPHPDSAPEPEVTPQPGITTDSKEQSEKPSGP
jgi:tetratricopeptide (TPR) repeat protein